MPRENGLTNERPCYQEVYRGYFYVAMVEAMQKSEFFANLRCFLHWWMFGGLLPRNLWEIAV